MARHTFNFDGGDYLTTMGASWFVSYSYHTLRDKTCRNWEKVETSENRIKVFNTTKNYHEFWLRQILTMNNANLEINKLGLNAVQVKQMARNLLEGNMNHT
jgi:hypothetical protein